MLRRRSAESLSTLWHAGKLRSLSAAIDAQGHGYEHSEQEACRQCASRQAAKVNKFN